MKFLLDTSILLWSVAEEHKLNSRAKGLLASKTSELHLSSVVTWEIAIKYALGSLPLHSAPEVFIPEVIRGMELRSLDITSVHAIEAGRLPHHHRDPFDRMLVAQAVSERMVLLTADRVFERYEVDQIFCGK